MLADRLIAIGYSCILFVAAYGLGATILQFWRIRFASRLEAALFAVGIGYPVIAYTLLAAGLFGALSREVAMVALVAALAIGLPRIVVAVRAWRPVSLCLPRSRLARILIGLLIVHALLNLIGALAPPTRGDVLRQHLAAPKYYARAGGFPFFPIAGWNMPATQHVLYTQALLLSNDVAPAVIHYTLGFLTILAIYVLGARCFSPMAGLMGAVIFYTLPMTTDLSSAAMIELGPDFLVVLALIAMLNSGRNLEGRWILLAGLLAGWAGASKQWALMAGPAGLAAIVALQRRDAIQNWKTTLRACFIYGLAFNLVLSPWLVRNFLASGDPLWPLGYRWLHSRYYAEWQYLRFSAWQRGPGTSFADFLLGPWNLVNRVTAFMNSDRAALTPALLSPVLLAFIPVVYLVRRSGNWLESRARLTLGVFCLTVYTIWFLGGYQHPRYLQVIHPLLALLAGAGLAVVLAQSTRWLKRLSYAVLGTSLAIMLAGAIFVNASAFPVVLGLQPRDDYLRKTVSFYSGFAWANDNLPNDAVVLLTGTNSWYYMNRDYYAADSSRQGFLPYHEIADPVEFLRRLRDLGVTHVLLQSSGDTAILPESDPKAYLKWLADKRDASDVAYYQRWPSVLLAALKQQGYLQLLHHDVDTIVESRAFGIRKPASFAVYALQP